jgi:GT2 family glycosyltransferase
MESQIRQHQQHDPLVSVIVLSYNRPQFLRESLEYIYKQSYRHLEVLVMDNASSCPEQIREAVAAFPDAKLYIAKMNVGYTGGMNAGVAFAKGTYVYLTEDDMFSEPDCIERLVRYAESDSSAAIVSGSIYSREADQLICCGGQVTLSPIFSWVLYNQTTRESCPVAGPYCANYTTGAMMLLRREQFMELGGFRDDFFMYSEDTELCLRSRAHHQSVVIVPNAVATSWHTGNAPETQQIHYHRFKNFFALYLLHARVSVLPEFFLRHAALGLIRQVRSPKNAKTLLAAIWWNVRNLPRLLRERKRGLRWSFSEASRANWIQDDFSRE